MKFFRYAPLIEGAIYFYVKRKLNKTNILKKLEPQIIIVDVDGTIIDSFIVYDILVKFYGKEKADAIEKEFNERLKRGSSVEEEIIFGIEKLYSDGIDRKHLKEILDEYEANGKIRKELVSALQELKKEGKIILIITKGIEDIAKMIAEKYGFDAGFGSKIDERGKVVEVIGTRRRNVNGVRVITKIDKAKEFCESKGIKFDRKKVCILSDDIYDLKDMKRASRCILTISDNPVHFQRLAMKLKLYDESITNDLKKDRILKIIKGC